MVFETFIRRGLPGILRELDLIEKEFPANRHTGGHATPQMNVYAGNGSVLVKMLLPGIDMEKLSVVLEGNLLTIGGEYPQDTAAENGTLTRRERSVGKFERRLKLPFRGSGAETKATLAEGVLTVSLEKPEDEKPRTIKIDVN